MVLVCCGYRQRPEHKSDVWHCTLSITQAACIITAPLTHMSHHIEPHRGTEAKSVLLSARELNLFFSQDPSRGPVTPLLFRHHRASDSTPDNTTRCTSDGNNTPTPTIANQQITPPLPGRAVRACSYFAAQRVFVDFGCSLKMLGCQPSKLLSDLHRMSAATQSAAQQSGFLSPEPSQKRRADNVGTLTM